MLRRRNQPEPERYIVETVVYRDPLAEQRWQVVQDMLNGIEIEPDDSRLKAFDDPYWTGTGYSQAGSRNERTAQHGSQEEPGYDPLYAPFEEPLRQIEREVELMERLANMDMYDPMAELEAEIDAAFAEANLSMSDISASMRQHIPPHAEILYHSIGYGERNRDNG